MGPAEEKEEEEAEEEEEERTYINVEEGAEVEREDGGEATEEIFTVSADEGESEEGITHLVEIRTKLKFIGNQVKLRNPELVPALVKDIKDIMEKHAGSKFVYCLHVGTSASDKIKKNRPGFMEGRVKSL